MSGKKNAKLRLFGVLNHRRLRGTVSGRKIEVVVPDPRDAPKSDKPVRQLVPLVK